MSDNVKTVTVRLTAEGVEEAKLKIDDLTVKADELGRLHPEIQVKIDSAKALLEARLLRSGIQHELARGVSDNAGGGGGFASFLTTPLGGGLGPLPAAVTSPAGIAAMVAAVGLLLPELGGIVAGLSAATAGIGAFGLLAIPTFDKIKNAYTAINTAQKAYNQAAAINKEDPTAAHATAAAAALLKLKVAEEGMSPATRSAVSGIQSLVSGFETMAKAFQPTVLKVFNDALTAANHLLPTLKAPAQDAGNAIAKLLAQFDKFTQSKGFQNWLSSFDKLIGPSIGAIGHGIDLVITEVGKLITRFSGHDVAHALNIFFDTIFGVIVAVVKVTGWLMTGWDKASAAVAVAWHNMERWAADGAIFVIGAVRKLVDTTLNLFGTIIGGAAKAFGWIPGIGGQLKQAAAQFGIFRGQVEGQLASAQRSVASFRASLEGLSGLTVNTYVNVNTIHKGGNQPLGVGGGATGGAHSGMFLAGEYGPELVQAPFGSHVYTARQTSAMMSGATGGSNYTININTLVADRNTGARVVEAIKQFEQGSGKSWRKP